MITLFQAFLRQIQILLFGSCLFLIRCIIEGKSLQDIKDSFPDFSNKYFVAYLVILWFGVFTLLTYYYQFPEYGIWSHLFATKFGRVVAVIIVSLQILLIYDMNKRKTNA